MSIWLVICISSVLSVRLREGYSVQEVLITKGEELWYQHVSWSMSVILTLLAFLRWKTTWSNIDIAMETTCTNPICCCCSKCINNSAISSFVNSLIRFILGKGVAPIWARKIWLWVDSPNLGKEILCIYSFHTLSHFIFFFFIHPFNKIFVQALNLLRFHYIFTIYILPFNFQAWPLSKSK